MKRGFLVLLLLLWTFTFFTQAFLSGEIEWENQKEEGIEDGTGERVEGRLLENEIDLDGSSSSSSSSSSFDDAAMKRDLEFTCSIGCVEKVRESFPQLQLGISKKRQPFSFICELDSDAFWNEDKVHNHVEMHEKSSNATAVLNGRGSSRVEVEPRVEEIEMEIEEDRIEVKHGEGGEPLNGSKLVTIKKKSRKRDQLVCQQQDAICSSNSTMCHYNLRDRPRTSLNPEFRTEEDELWFAPTFAPSDRSSGQDDLALTGRIGSMVLPNMKLKTFEEWRMSILEEKAPVDNSHVSPLRQQLQGKTVGRFNYASIDCSAKVIKTNSDAEEAPAILFETKERYMLNPCKAEKWFAVELCDQILVDTVVLANFEFFSSVFQNFTVYVSSQQSPEAWHSIGQFTAANIRETQIFPVSDPVLWARYVKVEFMSHYGSEFYCPISLIRVHGITMIEDYHLELLGMLNNHELEKNPELEKANTVPEEVQNFLEMFYGREYLQIHTPPVVRIGGLNKNEGKSQGSIEDLRHLSDQQQENISILSGRTRKEGEENQDEGGGGRGGEEEEHLHLEQKYVEKPYLKFSVLGTLENLKNLELPKYILDLAENQRLYDGRIQQPATPKQAEVENHNENQPDHENRNEYHNDGNPSDPNGSSQNDQNSQGVFVLGSYSAGKTSIPKQLRNNPHYRFSEDKLHELGKNANVFKSMAVKMSKLEENDELSKLYFQEQISLFSESLTEIAIIIEELRYSTQKSFEEVDRRLEDREMLAREQEMIIQRLKEEKRIESSTYQTLATKIENLENSAHNWKVSIILISCFLVLVAILAYALKN